MIRIRGSEVSVATGYGLDDRGSMFENLYFSSYLMGIGALSLRAKRQGREADYSPPSSVQVKETWIYTSTCPHVFMAQR
jgi:hypothetical protein